MRAMFANLTSADFGWRSKKALRAAERQRVHALFDEIQIAIHNDDHARLEVLMVKLATTTRRLPRRPPDDLDGRE